MQFIASILKGRTRQSLVAIMVMVVMGLGLSSLAQAPDDSMLHDRPGATVENPPAPTVGPSEARAPTAGSQLADDGTVSLLESAHNFGNGEVEGETAPPLSAPISRSTDAGPFRRSNLLDLTEAASLIFVGEVVSMNVRDRGRRVLVTDYVFHIDEIIQGDMPQTKLVLTALGGELPDGAAMLTNESLKLTVGNQYVVFLKPGGTSLVLPFLRVLQVHGDGGIIANESGRAMTFLGLDGGMQFHGEQICNPLRYGASPSDPTHQKAPGPGAVEGGSISVSTATASLKPLQTLTLPSLLVFLRTGAIDATYPDGDNTKPGGGNRFGQRGGGLRAETCGYVTGHYNFFCNLPDDNHWNIFLDYNRDYDDLVDINLDPTKDNDYLIGYKIDINEVPIRDHTNPQPGNGDSEMGVFNSAEMQANGYDTWESLGNPNGVVYWWYVGAACTRIVEADIFINAAIADDYVVFRKALTKLFGHALSLVEHDIAYSIVYTGLASQHATNYSTTAPYIRGDDALGIRTMLEWVNVNLGETYWVLEQWADMAVYSQTHDNPGSSGNLVMATASPGVVAQGDILTIENFHIENRGNLDASGAALEIYLSTNTTISTLDYRILRGWWTIPFPGETFALDLSFQPIIPDDVPPGTYYLGLILTTQEDELTTLNNWALLRNDEASGYSPRTIEVIAASCDPDIRIEPTTLTFARGQPTPTDTINVEIDWMDDGAGHSHQPQQAEIDAVVEMFACQGITLNVDLSNAIAHIDVMARDPDNLNIFFDYTGTNSFGAIKNANFDNAGQTGWHYCVFGHNYMASDGTTSGSSGLAELNNDDLIVTLGFFGTPWNRAATFAHELGHNLGLTHAGQNQNECQVGRRKPNYPSVMAYRFQLRGVRNGLSCDNLADNSNPFKELDYSHGTLASIDEAALDENIGIGFGAVDWDCSGAIDPAPVSRDIGGFDTGDPTCPDSGNNWCNFGGWDLDVLTDYDDWSNICDSTWNDPTWGGCTPTRIAQSRENVKESEPCMTPEKADATRGGCPQPPLGGECANYPDQSFIIYNDGAITLNVTSIGQESVSAWLSSSPAPPYAILPGNQQEVVVSVNTAGLANGVYWDRLEVNSDDACGSNPYPNAVYVSLGMGPVRQLFGGDPADAGDPTAIIVQATLPMNGNVPAYTTLDVTGTATYDVDRDFDGQLDPVTSGSVSIDTVEQVFPGALQPDGSFNVQITAPGSDGTITLTVLDASTYGLMEVVTWQIDVITTVSVSAVLSEDPAVPGALLQVTGTATVDADWDSNGQPDPAYPGTVDVDTGENVYTGAVQSDGSFSVDINAPGSPSCAEIVVTVTHTGSGLFGTADLEMTVDAGSLVTTTYIGPSPGTYNDPANWDVNDVPICSIYNVIIPDNRMVNFDVPGDRTITGLSLGSESTLDFDVGESLDVENVALISGIIDAGGIGAGFSATSQFASLGNNARAYVSSNGTVAIGDVLNPGVLSYYWTNDWNDTILFSADGTGSLLNLSALGLIDANAADSSGSTQNYYTLIASDGGRLDLSGLTTIIGPTQEEWLRFRTESGGVIDLFRLVYTTGRVFFDPETAVFSLPSLLTISSTWLQASASNTIDLPVLISADECLFDLEDGSTIDAPNLTTFTNCTVTLNPSRLLSTSVLTEIDNSRVYVDNGATFDSVSDTDYYWTNDWVDTTLFRADGMGSLLNLSSLRLIDASAADSSGSTQNYYTLVASDGGRLDFSGLTTVTGPAQEEWLRFRAESSGEIDLSGLEQTTGRVVFDSKVAVFSLPVLQSSSSARFEVKVFNTIDLPVLTNVDGCTFDMEDGATIDAPNLTTFTNSTVTLTPSRFLLTPVFTEIDDSQIHVRNGVTFDRVSDAEYYWTNNWGSITPFSADGTGSLLNLSSLELFDASAAGASYYYDRLSYSVIASNAGTVDLSGLTELVGPDDDEWLVFTANSGGHILFGSLVVSGGRTQFTVDGTWSGLSFEGGLEVNSSSQLIATLSATLTIGGDFSFDHTNEADFDTGAGTLHMNGAGTQLLEVAGDDVGLPSGSMSGNFEFGQLVIGQESQPTIVRLVDAIDNGNRAGSGVEALYLQGFPGSINGLRILGGSTLVIENIQVYAQEADEWAYINNLFPPGVNQIAYDEGFIALSIVVNDCNSNGIDDHADIVLGLSPDCNENDLPDECEIASGTSEDCNTDGIPDECRWNMTYWEDNFESGAGLEWSLATTDSSVPIPFTQFSGRFGNEAQTLTLAVTPGGSYQLGFDLCIIDSWNGPGDYFNVHVDGTQVFRETFHSDATNQSYPEPPDVGPAPFGWGSYNDPYNDSIYRDITIPFTATSSTVQITFQGEGLGSLSDESWGIDNVNVIVPVFDDCNENQIPDECEIDTDPDCNSNGMLDACDVIPGPFGPNLLVNPGAETGDISGWTANPSFTVRTASPTPFEGAYFFYARWEPQTTLEQTVDLISQGYSDFELDSGLPVQVGGYQRCFDGSDEGQITVEFLDSNMTLIQRFAAPVKTNFAAWELTEIARVLPVGARFVRYVFTATRYAGSNNDAYLDGAFVRLGFEPSASWDCNDNQIPDECDIGMGTSIDGNSNGTPDECEDCNNNSVPDFQDLTGCDGSAWCDDCNGNGILDGCDIDSGPSGDVNVNGIPDECEADCNGNGVPDNQDIAAGTSQDCQPNGVPDGCDIAAGTNTDVNGNSIPDECELDCQPNGMPDDWDISTGASQDCQPNAVPDECEVASGASNDINGNTIPDECEPDCQPNGVPDNWDIFTGASEDCNANGQPDECDLSGGGSVDSDGNGIPDECQDCNTNGVLDYLDLAGGTSTDCNGNVVPDECEPAFAMFLWVGPDQGSFTESANWNQGAMPGGDVAMTNTVAVDNRSILSAPGEQQVCGLTIEATGAGNQILQIDNGSTLHAVNGTTVTDGGEIDLHGGTLAGAMLGAVGGSLVGYGTVTADVSNAGRIAGSSGQTLTFTGSVFDNQTAGLLSVPIGSLISVQSSTVRQAGEIDIRAQAVITFNATLANTNGGTVTLLGGAIGADGLTNAESANIGGFGTIDSNVVNDGNMTFIADTQIVGNLANEGRVVIQSGTLMIMGNLTGAGEIVGNFFGRRGANGLTVLGDLSVNTTGKLTVAYGTLAISGNFDVAIDNFAGYDLTAGTVQLVGLPGEGPQTLELLAENVGRDVTLPDASLFSLNKLRLGPTATTVQLVDSHDNAAAAGGETLYVNELVIEEGVTLDLAGLQIHYVTITPAFPFAPESGVTLVDSGVGGCLVPIGSLSKGDWDNDGDIDTTDYAVFVECLAGPGGSSPLCGGPCFDVYDFDVDGDVDLQDFAAFQDAFTGQ